MKLKEREKQALLCTNHAEDQTDDQSGGLALPHMQGITGSVESVSKRERKGRLKLLGTDGPVDIRTSWAASPQLKLLFNPKSWKVPISSGCFCLIWRTFNHHIAFMVDDQRIRTIKLSGLNVEWNAKDSANSQYKLFSPHLYYLSNHSRPSPCRKCPFVCLRLARVGAGSSQP